MSDATEATGALRLAAQLIDQAIEENDPTERLGKLLALKEVASQAVKFGRRHFLSSAGIGGEQQNLPLDDGPGAAAPRRRRGRSAPS